MTRSKTIADTGSIPVRSIIFKTGVAMTIINFLPFAIIVMFIFLIRSFPTLFMDKTLIELKQKLKDLEDDYKKQPSKEKLEAIKHLKFEIELYNTDG